MGIKDLFKKMFTTEDDINDPELIEARRRHGIQVETPGEKLQREKEEREDFDPWEEVSNSRMNFFLGSWASKKFHVVGEDKVKKELEELEKRRQLEEELRKADEKK